MGAAVTTADVVQQTIHTMIETIGRKTSEGYAVIAVRGIVKKLQPIHPCLQYLEIRNIRYMEFGSSVVIDPHLNEIDAGEVGQALREILIKVTSSMRKSAGFFLLKELRDRLGADYLEVLLAIGVDLNLLQFSQEMHNKEPDMLAVLPVDIVRRVLKTTLGILEHRVSRAFAFRAVSSQLLKARDQFPFLEAVTVSDIRITLGTDEVKVDEIINTIDPLLLGSALDLVVRGINSMAQDHSGGSIYDALKAQLTSDYLSKLQEFGVSIDEQATDVTAILREVVRALIEVLSRASTEEYAVLAVNTFLHAPQDRMALLHSISIKVNQADAGVPGINIMMDSQEISENDARRAIQGLLEAVIRALGEKLGGSFVAEFRKSLEKTTLIRIEQMGVNLHIIELHEEMRELHASGARR